MSHRPDGCVRCGAKLNEAAQEYTARLEKFEAVKAAKERVHQRIGVSKLAVIGAGLVLLWFVLDQRMLPPYWLLVPIAAYALLAIAHELIVRSQRKAETAAAYFRRGLARIEDRWQGTGQTGDRFRDPKHVYAEDLDLFGRGCLFELLSTARLPMGEECLAGWLKQPSAKQEALQRQTLVKELRAKRELALDLAIAGEDLRTRMVPESLVKWAEAPALLPAGPWRIFAALDALSVAGAVIYWFSGANYWPLLALLALNAAILQWKRKSALESITRLETNAEALLLFSKILQRLEAEPFQIERLHALIAELRERSSPASQIVRKLARIVYWIDARQSMLGVGSELPFLYSIQVAFAAEAWKRRWGSRLRAWACVAGEMEALLSLATYSYEHPDDPFPEFAVSTASPAFDGLELGHPLIPAAKCVRNSVRLDAQTRVLLVSGSNMSGKSTLLRTVGINAVLAMTGAPARAKELRLTPLSIGTRIRSGDSLQEGRSNFFTEILHIRSVFELAANGGQRTPLLFLFDELLEGTNSTDRRIGAEGLLRSLLERGAIGMVTTHDLALAEIGKNLGARLRNVHFEDHVEDGTMRFDYRLREGVVTKSNAIALMRIIGLEV